MNPQVANGFVELNKCRRDDIFYEDYNQNKPVLGKVKLKEFTKEFSDIFNLK